MLHTGPVGAGSKTTARMLHERQPHPSGIPITRTQRIAPLGYFAMGVAWIAVQDQNSQRLAPMLAIANGSDWVPQPITLNAESDSLGVEACPCWFSEDIDHHMGVAVGDLTGNGFEDLVVAVFSDKFQNLSGGGVKIYRGGPEGLDPSPHWIARGFAATGVALADLRGTGQLDIVASCLWEDGTIHSPAPSVDGELNGRARWLLNRSKLEQDGFDFEERVIERLEARGAGDVSIADVDLDGQLDLIFAGAQTAVLYGRPRPNEEAPWQHAEAWQSKEVHPFSFCAMAMVHPNISDGQLVVSSRAVHGHRQLESMGSTEAAPGIYVHLPQKNVCSSALQILASPASGSTLLPSALAACHDSQGYPCLIAGFVDAQRVNPQGAPVRAFFIDHSSFESPFVNICGQELPGGKLMAARLAIRPQVENSNSPLSVTHRVGAQPRSALNLRAPAAGPILQCDVETPSAAEFSTKDYVITRSTSGSTLYFSPELPPHSTVSLRYRTTTSFDIAATSSSAWPPAGAGALWRGALNRELHPRRGSASPPPQNTKVPTSQYRDVS